MNKFESSKPNPDGETPEELRKRAAAAQKKAAERRMLRQSPDVPKKKEKVDLSKALEEATEAYKKGLGQEIRPINQESKQPRQRGFFGASGIYFVTI